MAHLDMDCLVALERKVRWLAVWLVHNANHLRENPDGVKVGGHPASSTSLATVMTALYFHVLRPADRIAVKPHASPVFHAIQYLLGNQTVDRLKDFRALGGAQSYPSRTKDSDDVDLSTGSVGLGVGITAFAALVRDLLNAKGRGSTWTTGRMIALLGDAELDEGNVFEALVESCKHPLKDTWWIVDYNRQSLDGVMQEGLQARLAQLFDSFGWAVVTLKWGRQLQAAFAEPGGAALRRWIEDCPNQDYSALTFQGGAAWRQRLLEDLGADENIAALLARRDDAQLASLMTNLAGHDLTALIEAFDDAESDRPVCWIIYTIKGYGLPIAGHKDNHAGIMTPPQMAAYRDANGIDPGDEWHPFAGLAIPEQRLQRFLADVPFNQCGGRRLTAQPIPVDALPAASSGPMSTQAGFGKILSDIARGDTPLGEHIITTSPDVTVSTNLGPWVNRRGLFATTELADVFQAEKIASAQKWNRGPEGQHIELGIAEMNLFLLLGALGLSHSLFGQRLLPIGTVYDPFVQRGLDALNYACYQDARFIIAGTPSGITLAPEGGAHQSIGTPLIGMAQDGLAAFEPAFVDELATIMEWAFDYIQREDSGTDAIDDQSWLRDANGGSVYLRLSTMPIGQPARSLEDDLRRNIIDGAYWLRPPAANTEVAIAYTGVIAPQAMLAAGLLAEDRRDVAVLAVTSADRLNAGWQAAQRLRADGTVRARSHIERLLAPLSRDCGLITVLDGHPATLAWIGGVLGHRTHALGVEHFGQSGSVTDLHRTYRIDAQAIVNAAHTLNERRPVRYRLVAS